ncbi:hypothetical protein [Kitasatospora cineracea]
MEELRLDRHSPAFRPGRPLADALGATGAALADLAPAARDLEHA